MNAFGRRLAPNLQVIPERIIVPIKGTTIATTGNTDEYFLAPEAGVLDSVDFAGVDALVASDTNYITWSLVNLGQTGTGTTDMLAVNTTRVTGGSALAANTKRSLSLTTTQAARVVKEGDRLRLRAAVTGTLPNTVTFPSYVVRFR
jgi:hypothetical protein